ncbi:MAG: hypothetical protein KI793_00195 [Rivularia sp. (in: Bacteria)]|nr:hypothetical protein [Rivularia sp. MS3]
MSLDDFGKSVGCDRGAFVNMIFNQKLEIAPQSSIIIGCLKLLMLGYDTI